MGFMMDNTIFLLLVLFSLTILDMAVGSPREHKVMKRLKVGKTNIYKPIPSVDTTLVNTTLIIIPNILLMKPPIRRIIVDLINLLFI